jgi:hypothetical protein
MVYVLMYTSANDQRLELGKYARRIANDLFFSVAKDTDLSFAFLK